MSGPAVTPTVRAALDACGATCRAWPEQDEGPYHRAGVSVRRDVTEDAPGIALALGLRLVDRRGQPLTGASVEIWHCDALGRYSGFPPPAPGVSAEYVADRMFLRGVQVTGDDGAVEFRTVYPGWYPGRTVHVHLRLHDGAATFSQLYFPEAVNDDVLARPPYDARVGRDTTNASDSIAATGGGPAVLDVTQRDGGFVATACLLVPTGGGST